MSEDPGKLDISTFLLSSIHDMKNSLGVMAAYLEAALAQGDKIAPARDKTAQALYEAQRVNDHLVQLLALYKIDQAFYPFDPQDHVLADLVMEAMARVKALADSRGIALDCECAEEAHGWFDYELVFGVVVQALHNALRYARQRVLMRVAIQANGGVTLHIEDDGKGFPPFLLARVAAPQGAISFETGATGLGLYFSEVVARLHQAGACHGSIRLENGGRHGGGCFILELP